MRLIAINFCTALIYLHVCIYTHTYITHIYISVYISTNAFLVKVTEKPLNVHLHIMHAQWHSHADCFNAVNAGSKKQKKTHKTFLCRLTEN